MITNVRDSWAQDATFRAIPADLEEAGRIIPDADLQIAATAIHHDLELVTGNISHFQRIPSLRISNALADARRWQNAPTSRIVEAAVAELVNSTRERRHMIAAFLVRAIEDPVIREGGLRFRRTVEERISALLLMRRAEMTHPDPALAIALGIQTAFALMQQHVLIDETQVRGHALSDDELSAQIRPDQFDILVDLSGYSGGNRLLTFARKPAPVQVTAWGYATGTGLDVWDITDPTKPVGLPPIKIQSHKVGVIPGTPIFVNAASDGGALGPGKVVSLLAKPTVYRKTSSSARITARNSWQAGSCRTAILAASCDLRAKCGAGRRRTRRRRGFRARAGRGRVPDASSRPSW